MRTSWQSLGLAAVLLTAAAAGGQDASGPPKPWWQRGADRWYYKDDWKGLALTGGGRDGGFVKTVRAPGGARGGWVLVWGARGYRLFVNDKPVGESVDGCLIDDYDLSAAVAGRESVTIRVEGQKVCAEGEILAHDGKVTAFATGADWQSPRGRAPKTEEMAVGASHGAYHRAHNARLTTCNLEQRGKTAIAKALARVQKLTEQGIYLMRRYRPAAEVVSFDPALPWRRAERVARPLLRRAEAVLAEKAVPAQEAGTFGEAIAAADEAAALLAAAEAPVTAATGLYRAEREVAHLAGVLEMLAGAAGAVGEDIAEMRRLARSARRDFALGDWASVGKALARIGAAGREVRARMEGAARARSLELVGGVGRLDEFAEDRFAWLNARKLMGSDPAGWPFATLPSASAYIDLAGLWDFRVDPDNVGEREGWHSAPAAGWRKIRAPMEWERQGFTADNRKAPRAPTGKGVTGRDKPYNGFAWYRKAVFIPAAWRGAKVSLTFGSISTHYRIFVNGKPAGPMRPCPGGRRLLPPKTAELPAGLFQFGKNNTIAVQVYNHDNFGGIIDGPLAIYAAGARPNVVETPGPLSIVREYTWPQYAEVTRQTFLAGAMSPGVVVACDGSELELWGWRAKGFAPPRAVMLPGRDGIRTVPLDKPRDVLAGGALAASWLALRGGSRDALIVLERRPKAVTWRKNPQGAMGLTVAFDAARIRAVVLSMPAGAKLDAAACRWWAAALRRYPVSASQRVARHPAAESGRLQLCWLRYGYLALDAPGEPTATVAPVPMLASYALAHKHPHLSLRGATTTAYASPYAPYRVVEGADIIQYTAPAVDRAKVMKGVGELFCRSEAARNAHGGLTEREMFQRQGRWGFDHNRYAVAFSAKWDLPLMAPRGGEVSDDERLWKRLDELVRNCNDAGVQMMLCSFPEIESRRWRDRPDCQANWFEFWRRVAKRYAHLPDWAISYDPFNEPAYMNTDHWNRVMADLTRVIRSVDKRHTIVWESADGWAQPFWCLWMKPVDDDNVIYSFHHYGKHWGYAYDEYYPGYQATRERTQIDPWLEAILLGLRHDVAIHCGEFGLSMIQPADDGEAWLNDYLALFERFGIGWNWWNYGGDNVYRTGLAAGRRVSPYVPILRKWMNRSPLGKARRSAPRP